MNVLANLNGSGFDCRFKTRLVFGVDSVNDVGQLAREMGARRVLLVTDAGIVAAGHAARVARGLESAGLTVSLFDQVEENPTEACVERAVEVARSAQVDTLIGLGGGSAMDTAKGCNFILTNGGRMRDYWGFGKAPKPMLPILAIPTTAGTGSECQSYALIADDQTHQKMACGDPKAAPRIAILDPRLTLSQPPAVAAHTGIDALAHAIESAVTKNRNPLSSMFSREAFRLLAPSLPRVLSAPADLEARGNMLLGAALAGIAIENSMLGIAHSAANPLTAHYGIVHGEAVGLMLPAVVRFNAQDPTTRQIYADLSAVIQPSEPTREVGAEALAIHLESLLDRAGIARSLVELRVERSMIGTLAVEASRQWTAGFNPRATTQKDFAEIYEAVFERRAG